MSWRSRAGSSGPRNSAEMASAAAAAACLLDAVGGRQKGEVQCTLPSRAPAVTARAAVDHITWHQQQKEQREPGGQGGPHLHAGAWLSQRL